MMKNITESKKLEEKIKKEQAEKEKLEKEIKEKEEKLREAMKKIQDNSARGMKGRGG